ncbi:MAG TPA: hypothetical protein ENN79_15830, partial [Desulfobacteraceae bacterium]|nr:hypothetical protein [Desulfobacteraceae bacterium]
MKCPKCGYISFDYNQNCPKCKKSLREQSTKMNMPDYKPAPPFFPGSLAEKAVDFQVDELAGGPGYKGPESDFYQSHDEMKIDSDDENYHSALENEISQNEAAEHSNSKYEGISFDPGAIGLKQGREGREESGNTAKVVG